MEDFGNTRNTDDIAYPMYSEGSNESCKGSRKGGKKSYLDVWLVDFFSPTLSTDISDTTSLFILQLACIVNMSPRWKGLKIRVFVVKPVSESRNKDETETGTKDIPDDFEGKHNGKGSKV